MVRNMSAAGHRRRLLRLRAHTSAWRSVMLPRKDLFEIPDGVIYLDGNSLGPLPQGVLERTVSVLTEEWAGS